MKPAAPAIAPAKLLIITHEFAPFRGGAATYAEETARAIHAAGGAVAVWAPDYARNFSHDSFAWGQLDSAAKSSSPSLREERAGSGDSIKSCEFLEAAPLPNPRLAPKSRGEGTGNQCQHAASGGSCFPFPLVRLRAGGTLRLGHQIQFLRELWQRRRQLEHYDQVALASVGAHLAFMVLAPLGFGRGQTLISLLHGSEVLRWGANPLWRFLARRFFRRVKRVLTVSEFSRSLIEKSFLAGSIATIEIAPVGLTTAVRRPVSATLVADDKIRILTLARVHPRKGQLETARALGQSLRFLPDELRRRIIYQVGGAGDADYLRQIEETCAAHKIAFEYLGEVAPERLAETYARCDIFAMTSLALPRSVEGFGIAYLDAGFHGKPVIAYRSGGAVEAVRENETGLLVAEGNLPELAKAFALLISDAALRARLGAGGRHWAEKFDWRTTAKIFTGS